MNPISWLAKNVLQPIAVDVVGFFSPSNPMSPTIKGGVAAIGTTTLQQVDPVFVAAETSLEGVIDTALASLGVLGQAAEIPVNVVYEMLGAALKEKLDAKLGAAQAALNKTTGTTGSTPPAPPAPAPAAEPLSLQPTAEDKAAAEPDGFAAPKPQPF